MQLPLGVARIGRNVRYTAQSVGTRWGFTRRLTFGAANSQVAGLRVIRYIADDSSGNEVIKLAAYTAADGNLWSASPFVQGSVTQLTTDAFVNLANLPRVPGLRPHIAQAFNLGFVAMGNQIYGVAPGLVYDPGSGTVDQISEKPMAFAWSPGISVRVGQVVSPSTFETYGLPPAQGVWVPKQTGHTFRCKQKGITGGTQPVWPDSGDIADGTAIWEELTPNAYAGLPDPSAPTTPVATADGASPIVDGATVFLALTYVSAQGESINELVNTDGNLDTSKVLQWKNTTGGPVDLTVTIPPIPADLSTSGPLGANGATGYQLYAYIVPGDPVAANYTDPTFYAQVAGGPFAAGDTPTISVYPFGQVLPTVNTANVSSDGNVDTGVRFMVVFYETRTEYQTGFTASAPIRINVTEANRRIRVDQIPIGPYNTVARICAFTVAGASAAGPYRYVDRDDVESPGFNEANIPITSTRINDNTTTTAEFNITDSYLPGASDVTDFFNRIEVPPASDVFFSKTLQRVIYTGVKAFPSGFYVSENATAGGGEAIRLPGSNLLCAPNDGDRTICWRELRETQICYKENSGHACVPNDGDPNTWDMNELWKGSGPVGPEAVDTFIDDSTAFHVYVHNSGPYLVEGNVPKLIGRELGASVQLKLSGYWRRINWAVGYKIVTKIDWDTREVRFSVPLDGATENNTTLTLSFANGWEDPVIFAQRSGKLVPNVNGRKWSIDDYSALSMDYAPQRYQIAPDGTTDLTECLIIGSADGAVYTKTWGQYYDEDYARDQNGYFSSWVSVPGSNPTLAIVALRGASVSAQGSGLLNVYAVDDNGNSIPLSNDLRAFGLEDNETQRDFGLRGIQGLRWGIGFDNGGIAGYGFEVHTAILWLLKLFGARRG